MSINVFEVYLIHIMDMSVIFSCGRNSFMNTSPSFVWPIWLVTSQAVLCGGRQHLICHYMNFLWIGVHTFYFTVLWLVLSYYSLYLKKVPEIVSFGPRTWVTPKKFVGTMKSSWADSSVRLFNQSTFQRPTMSQLSGSWFDPAPKLSRIYSNTRTGLVTGCKPITVSGWSQHIAALGLAGLCATLSSMY